MLDQHGAHERILYRRLSKDPSGERVGLLPFVTATLPDGLPRAVTDRAGEILARLEPEGVKDFAG